MKRSSLYLLGGALLAQAGLYAAATPTAVRNAPAGAEISISKVSAGERGAAFRRAEARAEAAKAARLDRLSARRSYGLSPHQPMRRSLYTYHEGARGIETQRAREARRWYLGRV